MDLKRKNVYAFLLIKKKNGIFKVLEYIGYYKKF